MMEAEGRARKRRLHRKSRSGCAECKRRHVKRCQCDEGRPACASCLTAGLTCSFSALPLPASHAIAGPTPPNSVATPDLSAPSSTYSPSGAISDAAAIAEADGPSDVNVLHLQLFHHFLTNMYTTVSNNAVETAILQRNIVACAFRHRYLLYELLAFAAYDLGTRNAAPAHLHRQTAPELQSRALAGLDSILENVNEDNYLALLFFSHILAIHSFCELFHEPHETFGDLLEKLNQTVHLLRGVVAVARPWGIRIQTTELKPIFAKAESLSAACQSSPSAIPQLHSMVDRADVSEKTRSTYMTALRSLDVAIHISLSTGPSKDIGQSFAWLMTLSQDFSALLAERRPEALVFLAYYAVVLHRRRQSFAVGSAGEILFTSVSSFLGDAWRPCLEWPAKMIYSDNDINENSQAGPSG